MNSEFHFSKCTDILHWYFRKKNSGRVRGTETRKPTRKSHGISKWAPAEVCVSVFVDFDLFFVYQGI